MNDAQTVGTPPAEVETIDSSDPRALSFEQLIGGIHKFYRRFRENELAYRQINDTINQKREAIIPNMPTGHRDEEDQMITVPMDYEALMKQQNIREPEQREQFLRQLLGPWNNFFVAEYTKSLTQLKDYVDKAQAQMQAAQQPRE